MSLYKKIRRIEIMTTHLAEDLLAGMYHSAFKGKGMEFEEVREYQPGDEIRSIDWNVTARMNHPYIKNFREERELTVMLLVDISSSSMFENKSDIIAELSALIAFSAIKNNDKVGLILFSDKVDKYLLPKKGLRHVLRIIRELVVERSLNKKTDLTRTLSFLGRVQKKTAICFVISDFICGDYSHQLTLLAKKHDMILVNVRDPLEKNFPNFNLAKLTDLETGESRQVDTAYQKTQEMIAQRFQDQIENQQKLAKKVGAGFIDIRTERPYLNELQKFFKLRRRR